MVCMHEIAPLLAVVSGVTAALLVWPSLLTRGVGVALCIFLIGLNFVVTMVFDHPHYLVGKHRHGRRIQPDFYGIAQ